MPIERANGLPHLLAAILIASLPQICEASDLKLGFSGLPRQKVYDASTDRCEPIDTPDIAPTAYRDADGNVVMFALHFVNRVLRGPDLEHVKIDCHIVLDSGIDPDPSHYNDRRYGGSTWTNDGKRVTSIVHHEYHAETHKTCGVESVLGCWYNTILSFSSVDGGRNFQMDKPAIVAAVPFRQEIGQGRHRGFFSPSNIVSDGRYKYFLASTTGWTGQPYGVCLFRSLNPEDSASWRAYDGKDFTIRYADPYASRSAPSPRPCTILEPFLYPVQSLVRHRASRLWLAVWTAKKNENQFPVDGFYYATSRDLKVWSQPSLLRATGVLYNIPCGGALNGYPSLLDETAQGRNFDDVGDAPWLYYVNMETKGCATGNRIIFREKMNLSPSIQKSGSAPG